MHVALPVHVPGVYSPSSTASLLVSRFSTRLPPSILLYDDIFLPILTTVLALNIEEEKIFGPFFNVLRQTCRIFQWKSHFHNANFKTVRCDQAEISMCPLRSNMLFNSYSAVSVEFIL